jgi:putative transposase
VPWSESDAMDQRLQVVTDALSDRFTMTELYERYGVSRRIGYKWLAWFTEDGKRGLADRSPRPHTCPAPA